NGPWIARVRRKDHFQPWHSQSEKGQSFVTPHGCLESGDRKSLLPLVADRVWRGCPGKQNKRAQTQRSQGCLRFDRFAHKIRRATVAWCSSHVDRLEQN